MSNERAPTPFPWEMFAITVIVLGAFATIAVTTIAAPEKDTGTLIKDILALGIPAFVAIKVSSVATRVERVEHQTNSLAVKAEAGARAEGVIEGRAERGSDASA